MNRPVDDLYEPQRPIRRVLGPVFAVACLAANLLSLLAGAPVTAVAAALTSRTITVSPIRPANTAPMAMSRNVTRIVHP